MNTSRISSRKSTARKVKSGKAALSQQPLGRRERRSTQTRIRLFRCALRLFARRGLNNVTVEDITEAADVGKGTFFNYFQSKEHVLGVMAEIQLSKVAAATELAAQGKRPIRQVLHGMVLQLAEEPGRSPRLARALVSAFLASKEVRCMMRQNMRKGRRTIAALVAIGQQRGEIDRSLRKEQIAMHLFQSFLGTTLVWSLEESPSLRTAAGNTFDQYWRSIAASGKGKKR